MLRTVLLLLLSFTATLVLPMPAGAQDDITPPVFVDLTIEPKTIDTATGPVTLTVAAWIIDDLSGVDSAAVIFEPINGTTQWVSAYFSAASQVTGTSLLPIYRTTIVLPQHAEEGRWNAVNIQVRDRAGNFSNHSRSFPDWPYPDYHFFNGPNGNQYVYLPLVTGP